MIGAQQPAPPLRSSLPTRTMMTPSTCPAAQPEHQPAQELPANPIAKHPPPHLAQDEPASKQARMKTFLQGEQSQPWGPPMSLAPAQSAQRAQPAQKFSPKFFWPMFLNPPGPTWVMDVGTGLLDFPEFRRPDPRTSAGISAWTSAGYPVPKLTLWAAFSFLKEDSVWATSSWRGKLPGMTICKICSWNVSQGLKLHSDNLLQYVRICETVLPFGIRSLCCCFFKRAVTGQILEDFEPQMRISIDHTTLPTDSSLCQLEKGQNIGWRSEEPLLMPKVLWQMLKIYAPIVTKPLQNNSDSLYMMYDLETLRSYTLWMGQNPDGGHFLDFLTWRSP